jgi:hypothetical protein
MGRQSPEKDIRDAIKKKLQSFGWMVFVTHGNEYQQGFPDLYCIHPRYGYRWVETKNPKNYKFTAAQLETFPKFAACNIGIWILTGSDDSDIDKLFRPANWWAYLSVAK